MSGNDIYLSSLPKPRYALAVLARAVWTGVLAVLLIAIAISPSQATYFVTKLSVSNGGSFILAPVLTVLEMTLKAVLFIEVIGYLYHRFLQHLGLFTRLGYAFRRNQKFHWHHHNVLYPVGRLYKRAVAYVPSEKASFSWGWVVPGLIVASIYLFCYSFNAASLVFVAGMAVYAKLIVDRVHQRFHEGLNVVSNGAYFRWLDKVHLLHHFDQRRNFTICYPLMDIIFCTYMSPRKHATELAIAADEERAIVSDVINWTYMLLEANPTEYAIFVSDVGKHSRLRKKLVQVLHVFNQRLEACPEDERARTLQKRATDLLNATAPAQKTSR